MTEQLHENRLIEADHYEERKKRQEKAKKGKKEIVVRNNKVLEVTRTETGTFSVYLGKVTDPHFRHLVSSKGKK